MTYEYLLKQRPADDCRDRDAAAVFVKALNLAIHTCIGEYTPSQRNYVYKLRTVWDKRAKGEDQRWNTRGAAGGARHMSVASPRAGEDDLLVRSICEKYDIVPEKA